MALTLQHLTFRQRIARILAARELQLRGRRRRGYPALLGNLGYTLSFGLALVVGALATMAARFFQFHVLGLPAIWPDSDAQMFSDLVIAGLLLVAVRRIIILHSGAHVTVMMLGAWLALVGMHNAVHAAPRPFVAVFSQPWVAQVTRSTSPGSLLVRGTSIRLARS